MTFLTLQASRCLAKYKCVLCKGSSLALSAHQPAYQTAFALLLVSRAIHNISLPTPANNLPQLTAPFPLPFPLTLTAPPWSTLVPQLSKLLQQPLVLTALARLHEVVLAADEAPRRILKRDTAQCQLLLQHQGLAPVGGDDDLQRKQGGTRPACVLRLQQHQGHEPCPRP